MPLEFDALRKIFSELPVAVFCSEIGFLFSRPVISTSILSLMLEPTIKSELNEPSSKNLSFSFVNSAMRTYSFISSFASWSNNNRFRSVYIPLLAWTLNSLSRKIICCNSEIPLKDASSAEIADAVFLKPALRLLVVA